MAGRSARTVLSLLLHCRNDAEPRPGLRLVLRMEPSRRFASGLRAGRKAQHAVWLRRNAHHQLARSREQVAERVQPGPAAARVPRRGAPAAAPGASGVPAPTLPPRDRNRKSRGQPSCGDGVMPPIVLGVAVRGSLGRSWWGSPRDALLHRRADCPRGAGPCTCVAHNFVHSPQLRGVVSRLSRWGRRCAYPATARGSQAAGMSSSAR